MPFAKPGTPVQIFLLEAYKSCHVPKMPTLTVSVRRFPFLQVAFPEFTINKDLRTATTATTSLILPTSVALSIHRCEASRMQASEATSTAAISACERGGEWQQALFRLNCKSNSRQLFFWAGRHVDSPR